MKVSIPNITTSLFLLFAVPYLSWLCFVLLSLIFTENYVDIYKIIGLFSFCAFECLFLYVLIFKFKIVKIKDSGIYAFYPFLNKRKHILWENFHSIEADVMLRYRLPSFRKITIKGKKGREKIVSISLTDIEFENFNSLTSDIPIANYKKLRTKIDKELAKEEKNTFLIYAIASFVGFLFVLYQLFFGKVKSMTGIAILLLILLFFSIQNIRKTLWIFNILNKTNSR